MATFGDHVDQLGVKELRALITRGGLSHTDCLEKDDLRARAREARERLSSSNGGGGGGGGGADSQTTAAVPGGVTKKGKKKKKKKKGGGNGSSQTATTSSLASSSSSSSTAAATAADTPPDGGGQLVRPTLAGIHGNAAAVAAFHAAEGEGIARDVAKAAGVVWGDDPIPPRMAELQRRHDALVDIADQAKLNLHDIKDHNEYLAGLTKQIAEEGEAMKRKFRLATAQAVRSTNPKRAAQHEAAAMAIQRRQASFNKEVSMTQTEVDWLKQSPAYSQAMEFLDQHWIKTKRGDYVSKQDLKDDQETTFEDMLAQMKMEEESGSVLLGGEDGDRDDGEEGGLTAEEIAEALGTTQQKNKR